MEIQEFQDGRTSTLDPEASNLVKFIMFARLSCAISTHIVCLDVDHRLPRYRCYQKRSSQPMKEFLRGSMQMGWNKRQREWTDLLSRSIQVRDL